MRVFTRVVERRSFTLAAEEGAASIGSSRGAAAIRPAPSKSVPLGLGCPLRLAGVFDLQLTPHPGSVIGIVALPGGTPEFRVLQQLEPADDL